ncbi:MAG: hypothetical protein WC405_04750 [Syntrophales bacterium]
MTRHIGKKRWRLEPEFKQQFKDGKEHITCPKCNASLGDHWIDKKGKHYDYRPAIERQLWDDRRHIACPKCSELLAVVYWEEATPWERVRSFFLVGWKGLACLSVLVWVFVVALSAGLGAYNGKPVWNIANDWLTHMIALMAASWSFPVFLIFRLLWFYEPPPGPDDWNDWWYYDV